MEQEQKSRQLPEEREQQQEQEQLQRPSPYRALQEQNYFVPYQPCFYTIKVKYLRE
jgi:hypothetical protein